MYAMSGEKKTTTKGRRIYFVEFLRIFLIISVFFLHYTPYVPEVKKELCEYLGTQSIRPGFAVEFFFIIGGFFLGRKIKQAKELNALQSIGHVWIRLTPGLLFFYALLLALGARSWSMYPFFYFPTGHNGLAGELIGWGDWYVGAYFAISCLFIGLFSTCREKAWLWLCLFVFFAQCMQVNVKPLKGLALGGLFFGWIPASLVRGYTCMGIGVVAAYLSDQWQLRRTRLVRILATVLELGSLVLMFNFMYRSSQVRYSFIAVEFSFAFLLISASHSWGLISSLVNRMSWVQLVSRYTYSFLLAQAALFRYMYVNRSFHLEGPIAALVILIAVIPMTLIEYHLIEGWLVPKLKRFFVIETQ